MKFSKISESTLSFMLKYKAIIYIVSSILFLVGLCFIPINPQDYLFPLAGVFYNNGSILVSILNLAYLITFNFTFKLNFYPMIWLKQDGKAIPLSIIIANALVFTNSILGFMNILDMRISLVAFVVLYSFNKLMYFYYYTDKTKVAKSDFISDLILCLGLLVSSSLTFVMHVGEVTLFLLYLFAIALMAVGIYLFITILIKDRSENYVKRKELELESEDEVNAGLRELQDKLKGDKIIIEEE